MSRHKLTRQQIRFLKEIFKNNDSLKDTQNYKKWGTLDGILKQVEEGRQIVSYMTPNTNEYNGRRCSELDLKGEIITYKYNTLEVKCPVGILQKIKSFFNKFKKPEPPKHFEHDELIEKALDFMKKQPSFLNVRAH